MQEQEKMEMVWQAPELVELGNVVEDTQNFIGGPGNDGGIFPASNASTS